MANIRGAWGLDPGGLDLGGARPTWGPSSWGAEMHTWFGWGSEGDPMMRQGGGGGAAEVCIGWMAGWGHF